MMLRGSLLAAFVLRRCPVNALTTVTKICRTFSTTSANYLKEIQEVKADEVTTVEGVKVVSDRSEHLLVIENSSSCPVCRLNLEVKYTDVLILSQFLRPDGCLLSQHVTGVCSKQQRRLEKLVHQAQRAGLLPTFRPDLKNGRTRTTLRSSYKWKKYNVYYEDD